MEQLSAYFTYYWSINQHDDGTYRYFAILPIYLYRPWSISHTHGKAIWYTRTHIQVHLVIESYRKVI